MLPTTFILASLVLTMANLVSAAPAADTTIAKRFGPLTEANLIIRCLDLEANSLTVAKEEEAWKLVDDLKAGHGLAGTKDPTRYLKCNTVMETGSTRVLLCGPPVEGIRWEEIALGTEAILNACAEGGKVTGFVILYSHAGQDIYVAIERSWD